MSLVSARSSSRRSAAISSPWSAASEYQIAAVAKFRGTPSPRSWMAPSAAAAAPRPYEAESALLVHTRQHLDGEGRVGLDVRLEPLAANDRVVHEVLAAERARES